MSIGLGQFWQSVPNLLTSFLWTTEITEEKRDEKEKMSEKSQIPLTPNKSTLHTLFKSVRQSDEQLDATAEEPKPTDTEKKIQKNVSTLYRIISSQNIVLKRPEEITLGDGDRESTEYQEIKETQDVEKSQMNIAENAIYYVDEDETAPEEKTEIKTSSIEIILSEPRKARAKRSRSIIETKRSKSAAEPFYAIRKTNSTEAAMDLGDLSTIRFSFLDEKTVPKAKDLEYDVIDDTKSSLKSEASSENMYSSPRNSAPPKENLQTSDYVGPEATNNKELFYATSEILNRRPRTPSARHRVTLREDVYEDVDIENEKLPDIPNQEKETKSDSDDYADVDVDDYCRHREENAKKLTLGSKNRTVNFTKVRSKLNKTWRSMKNWMKDEKDIKENLYRRSPKLEITEIIHENLTAKKVPTQEAEVARSESMRYFAESMSPDADGPDGTLSDSETYMDMTRFPSSESSGDIFTLLRRKKDGSSASSTYSKNRYFQEVRFAWFDRHGLADTSVFTACTIT